MITQEQRKELLAWITDESRNTDEIRMVKKLLEAIDELSTEIHILREHNAVMAKILGKMGIQVG